MAAPSRASHGSLCLGPTPLVAAGSRSVSVARVAPLLIAQDSTGHCFSPLADAGAGSAPAMLRPLSVGTPTRLGALGKLVCAASPASRAPSASRDRGCLVPPEFDSQCRLITFSPRMSAPATRTAPSLRPLALPALLISECARAVQPDQDDQDERHGHHVHARPRQARPRSYPTRLRRRG